MKMIILFLLGLNAAPTWVDDIDAKIERIDREGELKKEKVLEDVSGRIAKRIIKLEKWLKFESKLATNGFFRSWELNMYLLKGDFIADHDISCQLYIHKGGKAIIGDGVIKEELTYYKNENEGIRYAREMEFLDSTQIDSVKMELVHAPFVQTPLTHDDYIQSLNRFKRFMKTFRKL